MRPMGSKTKKAPKIAVVVSRYNGGVTDALLNGAVEAYTAFGGRASNLHVFEAPGAFELSVLCSEAALTGRYAGVVALGCVIKGDTRHDEYINHAVAQGLTQASIETGVPIAFGLVTTENAAQATARAGGKSGNKGEEAMLALIDTLVAMRAIRDGKPGKIVRAVKDKTSKVKR